jgi:hypothetical protein
MRMRIFGGVTWAKWKGLRTSIFLMCGDDSIWDYSITNNIWVNVQSASGDCPNFVANSSSKNNSIISLLLAFILFLLLL